MESLNNFEKVGIRMTEWYKVGQLVNTHGVRGEVKILSTTDFPEKRFAKGSQLAIRQENGQYKNVNGCLASYS